MRIILTTIAGIACFIGAWCLFIPVGFVTEAIFRHQGWGCFYSCKPSLGQLSGTGFFMSMFLFTVATLLWVCFITGEAVTAEVGHKLRKKS